MARLPLAPIAAHLLVLLAPLAGAGTPETRTGLFPSGEAYAPPAAEAPPRSSHALVRTVALAGGRARVSLPVHGGGPLLLWTLSRGANGRTPALTAVRTPGQRMLRAGEAASADLALQRFPADTSELGLDLPGVPEAILVKDAEAGVHEVEIEAAGMAAVTLVAAEPNSPVVLTTWVGPLSRQPGESLSLHAVLRDGAQPLPGARVTARLASPGNVAGASLRLYDDGRHGDGAAGDGAYAASVAGPVAAPPGFWNVRFEAAGRDSQGQGFARTGGSGFMNEPGRARLRGVRARLIENGANEAGRRLRVEAEAAMVDAGRYRLDVIVAGAADAKGRRAGLAWGESSDRYPRGRAFLAVEIPLPDNAAGPYLVDVRLLGLDSPTLAGRTTIAVGP
jgi:hypothetical protein